MLLLNLILLIDVTFFNTHRRLHSQTVTERNLRFCAPLSNEGLTVVGLPSVAAWSKVSFRRSNYENIVRTDTHLLTNKHLNIPFCDL